MFSCECDVSSVTSDTDMYTYVYLVHIGTNNLRNLWELVRELAVTYGNSWGELMGTYGYLTELMDSPIAGFSGQKMANNFSDYVAFHIAL